MTTETTFICYSSNDGWIIVTGTGLAPGAKLVPVEALAAARVQALEEAANRIKHHIGWFDDPALAHAAYMAEKKKLHIVMTI